MQGMNRVRRGYFEICPAIVPYFSTSDRDDLDGITATYDGPPEGASMTAPPRPSMGSAPRSAWWASWCRSSAVRSRASWAVSLVRHSSWLCCRCQRVPGPHRTADRPHPQIRDRVRCRARGPVPIPILRRGRAKGMRRVHRSSSPAQPYRSGAAMPARASRALTRVGGAGHLWPRRGRGAAVVATVRRSGTALGGRRQACTGLQLGPAWDRGADHRVGRGPGDPARRR